MSDVAASFREKFRLRDLEVYESKHWLWSLRPGQCTLGAGVLTAKSFVQQFSELSPDEGTDLIAIAKVNEQTLRAAFAYDKINYLMLMMVDPSVHYHVLPRYSREIEFAGRTWRDAGWPGPPSLKAEPLPDEMLFAIRDRLRKLTHAESNRP